MDEMMARIRSGVVLRTAKQGAGALSKVNKQRWLQSREQLDRSLPSLGRDSTGLGKAGREHPRGLRRAEDSCWSVDGSSSKSCSSQEQVQDLRRAPGPLSSQPPTCYINRGRPCPMSPPNK